jgi:hypothetical protein
MRNLVVAFEMRDWARQGSLVAGAIEEIGEATRIFGTAWYVRSDLTAPEAARRVWDVMGAIDGLIVIDVSDNLIAMFNVDPQATAFMSAHWHRHDEALPAPPRREPLEPIVITA